ncbi:long-chain-alcohol oxidase FAO4A-like [Arachis stenosperma]|uniref:long-chain-alcohol oxidase FAO4A-like n=1 Tax=Arachis stenosperma TaxID=217475 RepID=UPI0025AC9BCD|nr:long-chain-alcohol oxidase FAO4A-like [Arachis stenosperma]
MEENKNIISSKNNSSFRLGLGSKDHSVIELGSIDTQRLLLEGGGGEMREKQKPLKNTLNQRQMKTLIALCDTILPSINHNNLHAFSDQSLANFYKTSASMAGTPQHVGGVISERLKHPLTRLLKIGLWMLSTWIGTLILCGMPCLSNKFPFIQSFPDLPLHKRQKILQSWSLSYFHHLRMFFRTIKLLTLHVFFTQVDESEDNSSWKAIGYCGPDPEFKSQLKDHFLQGKSRGKEEENDDDDDDVENAIGPLYKGLVHLNNPRDITADALRRHGFGVSMIRRKPKVAPKLCSPSLVIQCDAVVVGSGSGGGVVAGVLAKAGYKVLVLEKGGYSARNNLTLLEGPTMDQMYLNGGMVATDDMSVLILSGSTVGGGSAINWSACIKTPDHVCKEWSDEHHLELFESDLYKEAMDVVCESMGVQSDIEDEGFNNAVLRKGCQEMGYPVSNIPRNSPSDHYCGWCCLGCKDGKKKGTSETWLVDLVKSGNGAILPGCEAIKVLHKKKRGKDRKIASGVAFEFEYRGAKDICVVESKVTIVACGALSTPELLKRSGLKNDNIGKNLHLHPVTMAWGYFPDKPSSEVWPEAEKRSFEGGIMTAMSPVVAEFEKSGYGAVIQTPSLHPGMFSIVMPWVSGTDIKDRMRKFSRTAHIFALARDKGSGTVDSPARISYHMEDLDEHNLQMGVEKILRILAAAGAEEIGTHHVNGRKLNVKQSSYHDFDKFVKEESSRPLTGLTTPLCSAHQMGSCRMGSNPKESAVNQTGETWEMEGLYVADSSVFPTALGVNPMITVQAIAYCTAQSVLEVLRRKRR